MTGNDSLAEVPAAPAEQAVAQPAAAPAQPAAAPAQPAAAQPAKPSAVTPTAQPRAVPATPAPEGEPVAIRAVADRSRTRRAPRFGSFIFTAIVLALLVAIGLSVFRDTFLPDIELQGRALSGGGMFLLLFFVLSPFFSLVAIAIAVWLDRRSVRRMERQAANR